MVSHFCRAGLRTLPRSVISSCIRYIVRESFRVTVAAGALLTGINPDVIRRSCGTRDEVEVSRDFLSARQQLERKRKKREREREMIRRRRRENRGLSREIFHGCKDGAGQNGGGNRRSGAGGVGERGRQRSKSSRRYHSLCGSRAPPPLVIIFFFMNELNSPLLSNSISFLVLSYLIAPI